MKPPTKFELMRLNRERGVRDFQTSDHLRHVKSVIRANFARPIEWTEAADQSERPASFDAPAVPTMEIDGVKYREALDPAGPEDSMCDGCAFKKNGQCMRAKVAGRAAFGGGCLERNVIYVQA